MNTKTTDILIGAPKAFVLAALTCLAACSSSSGGEGETDVPQDDGAGARSGYVVAAVVINDMGARTSYVQAVDTLDGHIDNGAAVEIPGNAVFMVEGRNVYVGLAEEPTWVKYRVEDDLSFVEEGRMSLSKYGLGYTDFGNAIVDADTAISVISSAATAVVWNPQTMEITGEIDLPNAMVDGFSNEHWTTVAHDGLVYIPTRWANWDDALIHPQVQTTIVDPEAMTVVGVAEDDRCASGGRIVFDEAGYGYVMGDGRNYSWQMFAHARDEAIPQNCILRIAPGETDFEEDFFVTIDALTDGLESITEFETGGQGSGVAFSKMFYPEQLPDGVEPVDFDFWNENAHKYWRIVLGDNPTAEPVEGAPFSAIGFNGTPTEGQLYVGESEDGGATSRVFTIDPESNRMEPVFVIDGYFNGVFALE